MEVDEGTPQSQPLREDQIVNCAGGFVWKVDDLKRLRRFLVLGGETPTYYISPPKLKKENANAVLRLLDAGRGTEVVEEIVNFSVEGRTPKQDPIIFCLAVCARIGDLQTKQRAYEVLSQVCRIPTHLFMFIDFCELLSNPGTGWGRAHRRAIQKWYTSKPPMKLAEEVTKYQRREGWSHADVARLMHLNPERANLPDELPCIMMYIAMGWRFTRDHYFPERNREGGANAPRGGVGQNTNYVLEYFRAVEEMKTLNLENEARILELIREYKLVREHIPTQCLSSVEVWKALLKAMPMTAMIRNLGKMTSVGLFSLDSSHTDQVCSKLTNEASLRRARIHPYNVLVALKQYRAGRGDKGKLRWRPNETIVQALENAFYASFKNVEATGKRHLLALDVSGSMTWKGCNGTPSITPALASAAMSMVTARTESDHHFVAFSHRIVPLGINSDMRLEEVLHLLNNVPMGGTDCALPMTYAVDLNLLVDVFIVYTDCETKAGSLHPSEALQRYREHSGIRDAKLIVVAMTSNGFTIADPEDPGMFDMVGFDSAAPQVMREFILGLI